MIALVCGGREFTDRECVYGFLNEFHTKHNIDLIVNGGARGADRLASEWALDNNVDLRVQNAKWAKHGKPAGIFRNYGMLQWVRQNMLFYGDQAVCIAFPGGAGTDDMTSKCRGILEIFRPDPANHTWYRNHELVVNIRDMPYDVYVGRPGPWGNPFVIGKDGTREEVLAKFREKCEGPNYRKLIIRDLRGKVLGCHCAPLPCHADILAEIANG